VVDEQCGDVLVQTAVLHHNRWLLGHLHRARAASGTAPASTRDQPQQQCVLCRGSLAWLDSPCGLPADALRYSLASLHAAHVFADPQPAPGPAIDKSKSAGGAVASARRRSVLASTGCGHEHCRCLRNVVSKPEAVAVAAARALIARRRGADLAAACSDKPSLANPYGAASRRATSAVADAVAEGLWTARAHTAVTTVARLADLLAALRQTMQASEHIARLVGLRLRVCAGLDAKAERDRERAAATAPARKPDFSASVTSVSSSSASMDASSDDTSPTQPSSSSAPPPPPLHRRHAHDTCLCRPGVEGSCSSPLASAVSAWLGAWMGRAARAAAGESHETHVHSVVTVSPYVA
jgi:hypothetical protein